MKKYLNADMINESETVKTIDKYELYVVNIDGIIYRSDRHEGSLLRTEPAFFGDYEAAAKYLYDESYIKAYKTRSPVTLLSLDKKNIERIKRFFKEYLINHDEHKDAVKVTYVMLQIFYGMIDGLFENLDLWGLSLDNIYEYFRNLRIKKPKDRVYPEDFKLFSMMVNRYTKEDVLPSRCSIRKFDRILMNNLKRIFGRYGIGGIWYSKPVLSDAELPKRLCMRVNRDHYDKDKEEPSCVPSEIGIFNPADTLELMKMMQRIGKRLVDRNISENQYEKEYSRCKLEYLRLSNRG
jgi:hypothetical protein